MSLPTLQRTQSFLPQPQMQQASAAPASMMGGAQTNLFGSTQPSSGMTQTSLFGGAAKPNPAPTTLFGGPQGQPSTSLFGGNATTASSMQNPQSGAQQPGSQTPLFGGQQSSGSLFGGQASGTSLFGAQQQSGSLFGGNTGGQAGGSLFGRPQTNTSILLTSPQAQQGGLFQQNAGQFGRGIGGTLQSSTVQPSAPPLNVQPSAPVLQVPMNQTYWREQKVEAIADSMKNAIYELSDYIGQDSEYLDQASSTLLSLYRTSQVNRSRLYKIMGLDHKVQAKQQRMQKTLEILNNYQRQIMKIGRDFLRVCQRFDQSQGYFSLDSPAEYLNEVLIYWNQRLDELERISKEIEQMLMYLKHDLPMNQLVQTLYLFQQAFDAVSSLTAQVHNRLQNYCGQNKDKLKNMDLDEIREQDSKLKNLVQLFSKSGYLKKSMEASQEKMPATKELSQNIALRDLITGRHGTLRRGYQIINQLVNKISQNGKGRSQQV